MAKNLGTAAPAVAPAAVRASRPGWRDPRLWVGVALVAVCVVAGARIVGSSDDTVEVWAVADQQAAGERLTADDLVVEHVHFADESELADYYRTDDALPDELELVRGVGAGELLPRTAVGRADDNHLLQVPVSVDPGRVPPSVVAGSVVDIYVAGRGGRGRGGRDRGPALAGVSVVSVVLPEDSLSASGEEQVTVATEESDAEAYFDLLDALDSPAVTVVRRS